MMPDCYTNLSLCLSVIKVYYHINSKFCDRHIEEDPTLIEAARIKTCVKDDNRHVNPMLIDFCAHVRAVL